MLLTTITLGASAADGSSIPIILGLIHAAA
jgi:hypothetical protein